VDECFKPVSSDKKKLFGISDRHPVLLYTGRIGKPEEAAELTHIYKRVKQVHPYTRLVITGEGPALQSLKDENADAIFMEKVSRDRLPAIYSSADLLILPSRSGGSFPHVVLEALSCGLPVIAYNTKSSKDIIRDGKDGFLVGNCREMCDRIIEYLSHNRKDVFRRAAIERSATYHPDIILTGLLKAVGCLCSAMDCEVSFGKEF
jgi:glycosyltransferase involved in cell wall biosynthesis